MKIFIAFLFSILILVSIIDRRNEKKASAEAAALEFQNLKKERSKSAAESKKREKVTKLIIIALFLVAIKLALY